jgi:signal transduction histidine kinase/ActR/RegA family two-component response regulator
MTSGPPQTELSPPLRPARAALAVAAAAGAAGAAVLLAAGSALAAAATGAAAAALAGGVTAALGIGRALAHARAYEARCAELEAELERCRRAAGEERGRLAAAERTARADAERSSRAKDEFVATVSHELRTPLNSVLGWARLLRMGRLDPAGVARAVDTIERSASALAQIVDDVLDVSRIVRGQLRLDVRPVELVPVIEAAVDAVRPAAAARQIAIGLVLMPGAGQVAGDPGRLQQVVWNLLSNALKFSSPGSRIEVRLDREGGDVVITVKDTGAGIDPDFLPHLFQRFRQADSSSTRTHGGLGLGLAIVRDLVEAHGGQVRAASEGRGRGATFTVRLPALSVRRPRAAAPAGLACDGEARQSLASLAAVRVLVVDDDADSLEVVRQVLEQAGAQVVGATSAREAMERLADGAPDVLLSDLGMPEEDGFELIRRVRALEPTRGGHVPAAALTAYTQAEDRRAALTAGFQVYLSKPIEPSELTAAVARLAGRLH